MTYWCSMCCGMHGVDHFPSWEVEINQAFEDRPPVWEESGSARGIDAEQAAERWAHGYDSGGDYTIIGGRFTQVRLRPDVGDADERKESDWRVFEISARSDPVYTAREVLAARKIQ